MTAPAAGVVEGGTGPAALHGLGVDHDHRGDRVALVLDPHPAEHQVTVEVLAEARKDGRVRMGVVPGQTIAVLIPFIAARIETGATIRTDGWKGYLGLERAGFASGASGKPLSTRYFAADVRRCPLLAVLALGRGRS